MRLRLVVLVFVIVAVFQVVPAAMAAEPAQPALSTLRPGAFQVIEHPLDVNVVFVGLAPGSGVQQVDVSRFLAALPTEAMPRPRVEESYGNTYNLGLHFTYHYRTVFASQAFDNAFFSYLIAHGQEGPPTLYQRLYNGQKAATRRITSNLMIDAVDTERWLGDHSASIGVDTTKYTIFFINWYGRPDFHDHLYNRPGSPDPDTGRTDATAATDSGPGPAWGGTTPDDPQRPLGSLRRIWFYDASAAVARFDWNIEAPEISDNPDGGSGISYRIPPIWEYGNPNGYRPFDDLTGDLAKLARYVAIDCLFTPSPLYDPAIHFPDLPSTIEVHATGLNAVPGEDAINFVHWPNVVAALQRLEPYNQFSYKATSHTLTGDELRVYECFVFAVGSCYPNADDPTGYSDFFYWMRDHPSEFVDGTPDLEIPVALFNVPDSLDAGFAGYTDSDHVTGAQGEIFAITPTPTERLAPRPIDFSTPTGLSFTPTDDSHFTVAPEAGMFDPAVGDDLHLGDDTSAEVKLPFTFPYLGANYSSVFVNSNGNITLGDADSPAPNVNFPYFASGLPRIAPLYDDLDVTAGGSITASVRPDRIVVTWTQVPEFGTGLTDNVQATLYASGKITFAYGNLGYPYGLIGLTAGGNPSATTTLDIAHGVSGTYAAGSIYEPFSPCCVHGATTTITHEAGHFLGLSHPHDGYDWQTGVDFYASGDFTFAWIGDYSDTVMSYLSQADGFSQFDRDALDRDMTSVYVNAANAILGTIYASGEAGRVSLLLKGSDLAAAAALRSLAAMDYRRAAATAKLAYLGVRTAASLLHIPVKPAVEGQSAQSVGAPAAKSRKPGSIGDPAG